jgi:hypothetical protein
MHIIGPQFNRPVIPPGSEAAVSRIPPFDGLDDILDPLRYARRLSEEFSGSHTAFAIAEQYNVVNQARRLAEEHRIAHYAGTLAAEFGGMSDARALAETRTSTAYASTLAQQIGVSDWSELVGHQSIGLSERELAELQGRFEDPSVAAQLAQMEAASEQIRRLVNESALAPLQDSLAELTEVRRLLGIDASLLDATSVAQRWLDDHSVASLMRDAQDTYATLGLDRESWENLVDPLARMRYLVGELEPLADLIHRYANPFEDQIVRLQQEFDEARRGLLGLGADAWSAVDDDDGVDADPDVEAVDAGEEVSLASEPDAPPSTPVPVVLEMVIASRYLTGLLLVRSRTAQLAARFSARAVGAPNDAADQLRVLLEPERAANGLPEWVVVISANQPGFATVLTRLSCRVLEGVWQWIASMTQTTGTTSNGARETLTLADARAFDDAVNALIAVLDDIELALP